MFGIIRKTLLVIQLLALVVVSVTQILPVILMTLMEFLVVAWREIIINTKTQ